MEKVVARHREAEPQELISDMQRRTDNELISRRMNGKVVIRAKETSWEQGRQGLAQFLLWEGLWDSVGTPSWRIFVQLIKKHSGKHIHQGGLGIFVIEGEGYTVVDGTRYDWEAGDLIVLPVKPGGCEHQHFNTDPNKPALWIAFIYQTMLNQSAAQFIQVADHPDWIGAKKA